MRIGIISTVDGYEWAGSEELWYRSALHALSKGHSVSVSVAKEMETSLEIKNLKAAGGIVLPRIKLPHHRLTSLKEIFFSSYTKITNSSDVILLSAGSLVSISFFPDLISSLLKSKARLVILCQFNSDIQHIADGQREILRKIFQHSNAQIFVSNHNYLLAQRQLTLSISNATVIYNPIKIDLDAPLKMPGDEMIQFASVARMEVLWKGHDVLLEVLGSEKWKMRNWHLNLYGAGPDHSYIIDLIKYFSLESKVTIHGQVRDIFSIWKKNHLMVLPSRGEGTPLAILEAMMCGRPTVTTDVGGNREIILEGKTGWTADAATPASFEKALSLAWENRQAWGEAGIEAHKYSRKFKAMDSSVELVKALVNVVSKNA